MYIARILYPVNVLGPGKRIGIWFNGCSHRCPGCSNPELWETQDRYKTTLETLMRLIEHICHNHTVDGFTLTGGDPFAQVTALKQLLPELAKFSTDILVYTGFDYEEVLQKYPALLSQIGVLIDGKYIQERNNGVVLRGSDNQRIIILNDLLADKYQSYLAIAKNEIHRPGYEDQVDSLLRGKGLENI